MHHPYAHPPRPFSISPEITSFQEEHGGIGEPIVVWNPASSHAEDAREYIAAMMKHNSGFGDRIPLVTERNPHLTAEKVYEASDDGKSHVVIPFSGDGGLRGVAMGIAGTGNVLVPAFGGNAGNVQMNTFPSRYMVLPHETLPTASVGQITPIATRFDGQTDGELSLSIVSIGMLCSGAKVLNAGWYRGLPGYHSDRVRSIYEHALLVPYTLATSRKFFLREISWHRHEADPENVTFTNGNVLDVSIVNAGVVGKEAHYPGTDILNPGAIITSIERRRDIPSVIRDMRRGSSPYESFFPGSDRVRRFLSDTTVPVNLDGDTTTLYAGQCLAVWLATDKPVHVATERKLA